MHTHASGHAGKPHPCHRRPTQGCTFQNNTSVEDGGAISATTVGALLLEDVTCEGNSAGRGGCAAVEDAGAVVVSGSRCDWTSQWMDGRLRCLGCTWGASPTDAYAADLPPTVPVAPPQHTLRAGKKPT
jgi:predicted outer membrane repeat protein